MSAAVPGRPVALPGPGGTGGSPDGHPPLTVIQGQTAERAEFPWMARLSRDGAAVCGAVLLSELWLVTAAHCLTPNLDRTAYQVHTYTVSVAHIHTYTLHTRDEYTQYPLTVGGCPQPTHCLTPHRHQTARQVNCIHCYV